MSNCEEFDRVSIFATCVVNHLFPNVAFSVARVLERCSVAVDVEETQACCGQPFFNMGYWKDAGRLAKKFLACYGDTTEKIVVPSGSCVSMIRNHYPQLFAEETDLLSQSKEIASRTFEFTEYLELLFENNCIPKIDSPGEDFHQYRVTYHEACHLSRELGITSSPRKILKSFPRIDLVEMDKAEVCCGFGGTFSVKYPEISSAMLDDKIESILETKASTVTACDASCLMNIEGGLKKKGAQITTLHIAEVVDAVMSGAVQI